MRFYTPIVLLALSLAQPTYAFDVACRLKGVPGTSADLEIPLQFTAGNGANSEDHWQGGIALPGRPSFQACLWAMGLTLTTGNPNILYRMSFRQGDCTSGPVTAKAAGYWSLNDTDLRGTTVLDTSLGSMHCGSRTAVFPVR